MIKILVCFNFIPNVDKLNESDWESFQLNNRLDFIGVNKILEPQDESALELSLRNKKESDNIFLAALIPKSNNCEVPLRTLLALGYDEVYIMDSIDFEAKILYKFLKENPSFDLIVTGSYSSIVGYRHFPIVLSKNLNVPVYTNVLNFQLCENEVRIVKKNDRYTVSQNISLPAILTIGDVPSCFLHVPTLIQRLETKDKPINIISYKKSNFSNDSLDGNEINNLFKDWRLLHEDNSRKVKKIIDKDPNEIARLIYQDFIREVK